MSSCSESLWSTNHRASRSISGASKWPTRLCATPLCSRTFLAGDDFHFCSRWRSLHGNIISSVSPGTWLTISRLIPIASIFTPATLSVESKAMEPQPTHGYYVPTINFDTLSYVAGLGTIGHARWNPQDFTYEGPSQALKRITTAVGALGAVLPIDPPSSNSSWDMEF
jgi:hypothetical protein